jgi:pimeloyl-CoA dehydrogenase large subunit
MDLEFTAAEEEFRREVREFARAALAGDVRAAVGRGEDATREAITGWQRALNARGWGAPNWPEQFGGTGWDPIRQHIFDEETALAGAPRQLPFGLRMVGPVLIKFGSPDQQHRFLPRIPTAEDWWCQGYSEPNAGSDLAGLTTRAERHGDHYVVTGQKTWTTLAQYADWIFCLVRTDPAAKKQQGISFLLIDMKTPGITVRPIVTIDGGREVNEVWFDEVRVPVENLVGEENKGWDYAKFLLGNERTGIARVGISKARVRRIKQLAALERVGDRPLLEEPHFREKLAMVEIELKALEMTQLRIVADERHREPGKPNPASSILKLKGSELQQATTELLMDVVGPYVLPYDDHAEGSNEPPIGPDFAAEAAPTYFNWRKVSIYGGSNEIQRNIVAKAILGF